MHFRALFVALLATIVIGSSDHVRAQDGLRLSDQVAFEPGEPFSSEKVPVRSDARVLSQYIDKYGAAPTPKALAVSEDGLHAIGVWPDPNRPPRSGQDTRRMALQHCEFRSGYPCRLVAVDNSMSKGEAPVVHSLPKAGKFDPDRIPFWSVAGAEVTQISTSYIGLKGPKALAIAPVASALMRWGLGATLDEAREKALENCVRPIQFPGIKCVVFVEGDEFVYGSPNGKRQLASGSPVKPREILVLYVGAYDCAPCGGYELNVRPVFLASPEGKAVTYREVKSGTYRSTMREADWPEDVRWIRELGAARGGTPRFIVAVDRVILRNVTGVGNWNSDALPLIQRLVAMQQRKT
jgi:hypothetical protein